MFKIKFILPESSNNPPSENSDGGFGPAEPDADADADAEPEQEAEPKKN